MTTDFKKTDWKGDGEKVCPLLSILKGAGVACLRTNCAWWSGRWCCLVEIAGFFIERRHTPQ